MEEKIVDFITKQLNSEQDDIELAYDEDLLSSGLVESMGMMRLVQFVEEEFNFKIEPQDMSIENFLTVNAITEFIKKSI